MNEYSSFSKEKHKLVLKPKRDSLPSLQHNKQDKKEKEDKSIHKHLPKLSNFDSRVSVHKLIRYSSISVQTQIIESRKKIKSNDEKLWDNLNYIYKYKYLQNILDIQNEPINQRRLLKERFVQIILKNESFNEPLSKFIEKSKHILQQTHAPPTPSPAQVKKEQPIVQPKAKMRNLKIVESVDIQVAADLTLIKKAKKRYTQLESFLSEKEAHLRQLTHQIQQIECNLEIKTKKLKQIQQKVKALKIQSSKYHLKIYARSYNLKIQGNSECNKIAEEFKISEQRLEQFDKTAIFNDVNQLKSIIVFKSKFQNDFMIIISQLCPTFTQSPQVDEFISQVQQKMQTLIHSCADKQNYVRKFQKELKSYFKLKSEKSSLLSNIKKEYSALIDQLMDTLKQQPTRERKKTQMIQELKQNNDLILRLILPKNARKSTKYQNKQQDTNQTEQKQPQNIKQQVSTDRIKRLQAFLQCLHSKYLQLITLI